MRPLQYDDNKRLPLVSLVDDIVDTYNNTYSVFLISDTDSWVRLEAVCARNQQRCIQIYIHEHEQ